MGGGRTTGLVLALPVLFVAGALVGYLARGDSGRSPGPAPETGRERDRQAESLARQLETARLEIADLRSRLEGRGTPGSSGSDEGPGDAEPDTPEAESTAEQRERAKARLEGLEYHLSASPTDAALLARYVTTAARAGEYDRAIALLEKLAEAHPDDPDVLTQLGRAYLTKTRVLPDMMQQGRLAFSAVTRFDAALKASPEHFDSRYLRGISNFYMPSFLGRLDQSIADFEKLVEQNSGRRDDDRFGKAYAWLGRAYEKAGKAEEARKTLEEGLELFPAHPDLLRARER